jgi:hypothetical protein
MRVLFFCFEKRNFSRIVLFNGFFFFHERVACLDVCDLFVVLFDTVDATKGDATEGNSDDELVWELFSFTVNVCDGTKPPSTLS